MDQYLPVVVLAALAVVFVLLSIVASRLLAPERPTRAKLAAYECGVTNQAALPERLPVRFYLVAMLFIMFDIEIVFLYPWAVANTSLGLFGLLAMVLFAGVFFLTFVYELACGGLEWGPVRRQRPPLREVAAISQPGVRTVGLVGREPPDEATVGAAVGAVNGNGAHNAATQPATQPAAQPVAASGQPEPALAATGASHG